MAFVVTVFLLTTESAIALLLLAIVVIAGFVRPRFSIGTGPVLLSNQKWGYRDFVVVWVILTMISVLTSPGIVRLTEIPILTVDAITALCIAASVWAVVRLNEQRPWRALGLNPSTAYFEILWSLRIGLGIVAVMSILVLSLRLAVSNIWEARQFIWSGRIREFIAAALVTAILFPVAEELLFRGLAYAPLFRRFGVVGATVGTAVLWAAAHFGASGHRGIVAMSSTFIFGVIYAEVYRRRASLVPPLVFHIVGNTTGIFILDRSAITLLWLVGASVTLWSASIVIFHARRRLAARR